MPLPAGVAAVFPFSPNWTRSVKQEREFKTDIVTSRNGTEHRRALRSKPRETLDYQILLEGDAAAAFEYRLWALQPYVLMLPLWPRQRRLAANSGVGTSTLLLDSPVGDDARPGDEWVLLREGQAPEVVTLDTISVDLKTLTLIDPLANDWAQYSSVYPAWRVQFSADIRSSKPAAGVLRAPLKFRRLVDERPAVTWSGSADLTIDGLEVFIRPFNWAKALQVAHNWAPEFIDAEIGPFGYELTQDLPPRVYKGELLLENRADVDWLLAFFDRQSGRQTPFLMPTWQDDLRLQPPLGGTDFEVAGTDLGLYQPADPIHTHLMVRKLTGSLAFFTVQSIVADGVLGITSITTVEPWDEAYGPESCPQACFVNTVRLASDSLQIEWITDEVAKTTLAVQTVEVVA